MAVSLRKSPVGVVPPKSWSTDPEEHRRLLANASQLNASRIGALENANVTVIVTTTPFSAGVEGIILVDDDSVGGIATVNLPPVAERSEPYSVKKIGTTAGVIVAADGLELIDGTSTKTIGVQYDSIRIAPGNGGWWII